MTDSPAKSSDACEAGFAADVAALADDPAVHALLRTLCLVTGMRFAAVARVTEARWIACAVEDTLDFGLAPGGELPIETTICNEVRCLDAEIVIDDAQTDPAWSGHFTPRHYGFRSYLSIPIHRTDGSFFGTLCALDPEPRKLSDPRLLQMARLFARLIGERLETGERLHTATDELGRERAVLEAQEQFLAILAHDLRNPLAALSAGLRILSRRVTEDPATAGLVARMDASVVRMAGLVSALLDHARARHDGGLLVERVAEDGLGAALEQIVDEFRTMAPSREFRAVIDLPGPVLCDRARIAQLLSNLMANAIIHGAADGPVEVTAGIAEGALRLAVANEGPPIPPDRIATLFDRFTRGRGSKDGLGLGLYIAAEIARAHGGRIEVASDTARTVFTFTMPA